MYGIFTYMYHRYQPHVGIYTIHGWYGKWVWNGIWWNQRNERTSIWWVLSVLAFSDSGEVCWINSEECRSNGFDRFSFSPEKISTLAQVLFQVCWNHQLYIIQAFQNSGAPQTTRGLSPSYAQIIIYFLGSSNLGGTTWNTCFNPDQRGEGSKHLLSTIWRYFFRFDKVGVIGLVIVAGIKSIQIYGNFEGFPL